jgi:tetratricopeptide (TPR) repeat protein
MSRSGADSALRALAGALLVVLALLGAPTLAAQTASDGLGLDLTAGTRQNLDQLEETWTQWSGSLYRDDEASLHAIEDRLLESARTMGMSRLPDLAAGALLAAQEAAAKKDAPRAERALAAAERLDPGRPEAAFAAARVNRLLGRWHKVPFDEIRGLLRLPALGLEWRLARANLLFYLLAVVSLAAGAFLALLTFVKGPELLADLGMLVSRVAKRPLEGVAALVVVLLVLSWPLLLPGGLLWLAGYWSVLLWGFGSVSQRWVTIALWLLLGAAPLAVQQTRHAVAQELSPPLRAAEDVIAGRLRGGLFADLGALAGLLPDQPAANHFLADVYRKIGQWDHASSRYRELLTKEPGNLGALVALGAHAFHREDFGAARDFFERAIAAHPEAAVAHFDLGKALHGALHYDEGGVAIQQAQALDPRAVNQWTASGEGVIVLDAGLERLPEIQGALDRADADGSSPGLLWFRRFLSVFVGLGAMLLAVGFDQARRRFRPYQRRAPAEERSARRTARWYALVPGLESAFAGRGLQSFLAVLLPVACLVLPASEHFGFRIPWHVAPLGLLSWLVAAVGLAGLAWYRAAAAYGDR